MIFAATGFASDIPDNQAVRAIIGESASEPYLCKVGVAAAIRNRGNLHGVYGLKSAMVDKQPAWVWRDARKAWSESVTNDVTHGASFWESTDFKTPYWASSMHRTCRIGKTVFYKK
jgi:spore germination cell wall hydrolase CwlJ-like protein